MGMSSHSTAAQAKGKLISLATETDRTLFFDFMPLELGTVRGFKTRFHLYTVPGQVFYEASRKLILKGVDGVVFVADSTCGDFQLDQGRQSRIYQFAAVAAVLGGCGTHAAHVSLPPR